MCTKDNSPKPHPKGDHIGSPGEIGRIRGISGQESGPGEYESGRLNPGKPLEIEAIGHQAVSEKNHGDCMAVDAVSREPFSAKFPV